MLNDAQTAILRVVANKETTAYQVSNELGKEPSAVLRSVQVLADRGFLMIEEPKKGVAKPLKLTDKGVSYAIVLNSDIDVDNLLEVHPYLDSLEQKQDFKRIIRTKEARKMMFVETCKYLVNNNLFDQKGKEIISQPRFRHYWITLTLELTRKLFEMNKENSGTIDFAAWRKYVERSGIAAKQVDLIINLNS